MRKKSSGHNISSLVSSSYNKSISLTSWQETAPPKDGQVLDLIFPQLWFLTSGAVVVVSKHVVDLSAGEQEQQPQNEDNGDVDEKQLTFQLEGDSWRVS